jgi:hypothetical protein
MKPKLCSTTLVCAAAITAGTGTLHAQFNISQFTVDGYQVQMHGFASQGFAVSNQNNYLTMDTSKGSFAFTDGGLNLSTKLTNKLRVGAQGYIREIGQIGGGRLTLDWAFADYKLNDWIGFRAGKVKTALGLFTDTQDAESLHTWALLPQALYPTDLRTSLIAHTGGDIYGQFGLKKAGSLSYTVYMGRRADEHRSGYYFNTQDTGIPIQTWAGTMGGVDVHWNTPVSGLMLGGSFLDEHDNVQGTYQRIGVPYFLPSRPNRVADGYLDYTIGKLHFNGEYRRNQTVYSFIVLGQGSRADQSNAGWFASASYRLTKKLEIGSYHSRFYVANPASPEPAANHIYDTTVTARYDVTHFWDVKVEGHFIDGYGDVYSARGFYTRDNPNGLKPTTDMLIVRTGFYF